jgi:hypothetical protein
MRGPPWLSGARGAIAYRRTNAASSVPRISLPPGESVNSTRALRGAARGATQARTIQCLRKGYARPDWAGRPEPPE